MEKSSAPFRMRLLCPAKINLFLFVFGKMESGYHEILSCVDTISLFDEIDVEEINEKENIVSFDSLWEMPQNNSVSKTLNLISHITGKRFRVVVRKRIPPGAGLGGASSDSGVLIKELSKKYAIDERKSREIAESIGSDVPLFLSERPVLIYGRGEKVKEIRIERRNEFFYVLVWPEIISETKKVYDQFDKIHSKHLLDISKKRDLVHHILNLKEISFDFFSGILGKNDLEEPFLSLYKDGEKIKNFLSQFGNFYLTGSGSTFYSIFFDEKTAKDTAEKLKKYFKFVFVCKPY
jgi:4-diphosphocytidyl-2-C-methyl-D-erythritol kinase